MPETTANEKKIRRLRGEQKERIMRIILSLPNVRNKQINIEGNNFNFVYLGMEISFNDNDTSLKGFFHRCLNKGEEKFIQQAESIKKNEADWQNFCTKFLYKEFEININAETIITDTITGVENIMGMARGYSLSL